MDPAVPFGGYKMSGYAGRSQALFVAYGIQIHGSSERRDD
jgi:hypothetical protein